MEGNRRLGLGLEWILGFGVEDENGGEARLFCSFFFFCLRELKVVRLRREGSVLDCIFFKGVSLLKGNATLPFQIKKKGNATH